jgi:hypothetical protein
MPIVEPGPIWEVDFAHDHAKTEFSHGLDPLRSLPRHIRSALGQRVLQVVFGWRSNST